MIRKSISLLLILIISSSCSSHPVFEPKPLFLQTDLEYGPVEFREGYNDGCESALSAYGNSGQKTYYSLSKNPEYEKNRVYNQVWKDAWAYCYMWLFVQSRQEKEGTASGNTLF